MVISNFQGAQKCGFPIYWKPYIFKAAKTWNRPPPSTASLTTWWAFLSKDMEAWHLSHVKMRMTHGFQMVASKVRIYGPMVWNNDSWTGRMDKLQMFEGGFQILYIRLAIYIFTHPRIYTVVTAECDYKMFNIQIIFPNRRWFNYIFIHIQSFQWYQDIWIPRSNRELPRASQCHFVGPETWWNRGVVINTNPKNAQNNKGNPSSTSIPPEMGPI